MVGVRLLLPLLLVTLATYTSGLAVMSVDVGSEYMKVAIVKPGVPMEIAINKESRRKTPVLVSIIDGDRYFGDAGLSKGIRYPHQTYMYILDLLGKSVSNPTVEAFKQRYPHYKIEAHPETGTVVFRHDAETTYTVEELMAMILENAKETAESFTEQPIHETVITVPPYFNQAERRAMKRSAELAGLNVLQLLNDNTAVALNYGVFRRKTFNATAVHYMFFDVGASKISATVAAYQLVKTKSPTTGLEETIPQLHIKGVGFDRALGGVDFQHRLRDILVKAFNDLKKTSDVRQDKKAMAKLFKEAGRVKHVLSANNDHYAQVESLMDDIDFRTKVTREELEAATEDLASRVTKVIEDALRTSEVTLAEISEVILMGGGTRVPKLQEILKKAIKREELGKSINTDEAGALGAVYQAAYLSKGYRVKRFGIKDANIYPIQVEFERARPKDDAQEEAARVVKRTLFGRMNPFPQKKVMTFNKHIKDFGFVVNYGDLSFLTDNELKAFGKSELFEVSLSGVEDAHTKHDGQAEAKGVKAHFRMDDSGIFSLDKVEALFEKTVMVEDEDALKEETQSTFSKIGSTISNLFGSSEEKEKAVEKESSVEETKDEAAQEEDKEKDGEKEEDKEKEEEKEEEKKHKKKDKKKDKKDKKEDKKDSKKDKKGEKKSKKDKNKKKDKQSTEKKDEEEKEEKKEDEKKEGEKEEKEDKKEKKETPKKPKPVTVREDVKSTTSLVDLPDPSDEVMSTANKLLSSMRARDEEKAKLAAIRNELESFTFTVQDHLYQDVYEKCSQDSERDEIRAACSAASDWLYEQDDSTPYKAYEEKLEELKKLTSGMYDRVKELEERPRAIEALNSIVNYTEHFLKHMGNMTGEDMPFTEIELTTLQKLITTTKEWNATVSADQAATPLYEKPKMVVEDVARKIGELDREVKYLVNKAKTFRPKPKVKVPVNKTEEETAAPSNETKDTTEEDTEDGKVEVEGDDIPIDIPTDIPVPPGESEGKRRPRHKDTGGDGEGEEGEGETLQLDAAPAGTETPETTDEQKTKHGEL